MTEPVEHAWLSFDEAAALLAMPDAEVARLLLSGVFRFKVEKRSPGSTYVLRMDVRLSGEDVRAFQAERWSLGSGAKADELVNRAALKFEKHPTRTSPGVRGPAKPKVK